MFKIKNIKFFYFYPVISLCHSRKIKNMKTNP